MTQVDKIRIFLGSPSDVGAERRRVREVINELNETLAPSLGVVLELKTSESTFPGFGKDGQAIINDQIGDLKTYDMFLAIFWNRIGTPTARDISGTVEEYKRALKALQTNKKIEIWIYFSNAPSNLTTSEELEQKKSVVIFKNSIRKKSLRKEYQNPRDFATQFRMHLTKWLQERNTRTDKTASSRKGARKGKTTSPSTTPQAVEPAITAKPQTTTKGSSAGSKTTTTPAKKRADGVVKNPGQWVMLNDAFFRADSTSVQADRKIVLHITPTTLEDADALRSLQTAEFRGRANISYADRHEAGTTSVHSITSESRGSKTTFTVTLAPFHTTQNSGVITDSSFNGYSPDSIANLRARYILLGEPLPSRIEGFFGTYHQRSQSSRSQGQVPDSLPRLWAVLRTDIRSFPYKAWLFAVYLLKTGGVVENITALELGPRKNGRMNVKFRGRRRTYVGQEAVAITVDGECRLEA